jgi:transposase
MNTARTAGWKAAARILDNISGKPIPVYVFVAVLPYSGYAYAEGFFSRNLESWIAAHIHAFQFFGGAARILTPDNPKTGVLKADLSRLSKY